MRVAEQGGAIADVRKIAVLRPNALGDFLFCLPALHALKQCYPDARISYLGKQWHADFLRGRPGPVDEVVVMPPYPGVGAAPVQAQGGALAGRAGGRCPEAMAVTGFIEAMRAERFDLALQLYGGGRYANPLVRRLGARCTVGMKASDAEALDRWVAFDGVVNKRLQLLEVAALAGAEAWPMHQRLPVTARDRAEAARCLASVPGETLVLLQPGASDPRRCWPARRFAQLGDVLAAQGALVAINGSAEEAPLVKSVIASMRHAALDLSGRTSLHALSGLLERSALLVSNDTGPLHLALEIGTPAVGIYWLTNLVESAPLRQHGHRAAVSLQMQCAVCGAENITSRCPHDASFVDAITLDEVVELALALLRAQAEGTASSLRA